MRVDIFLQGYYAVSQVRGDEKPRVSKHQIKRFRSFSSSMIYC